MARTVAEWSAHPQAAAIAPWGRVSVEKIGESATEVPRGAGRPLDGVRVLDLSRLLAGPTNARTLAEHGAEVLLVNSARLENIPLFVMDTSHGKRSCCLELDDPADAAALRELARGADVFTQGYRGGSLARRGFGPEELAATRPGIVVVTINCYGDGGPWHLRPGWEQMAQTVSGMVIGQGTIDHPALVPAAACDYTTGYLAALGTMAALWRRAHEGGSYHVRASLCQTARWFTEAPVEPGRVDRLRRPRPVPGDQRHALRTPAPPRAGGPPAAHAAPLGGAHVSRRHPRPSVAGGHGQDLTTRQVGHARLATLPGDGSARPPRGPGVPPGDPELPARAPGGGVRRAGWPGRFGRRDLRFRGTPSLGEGAGGGRLDRPGLAGRIRRSGRHHDRAGHLQRGVRPTQRHPAGSTSWARGCSARP